MSRLSADEAIQGVAGAFGVVVPLSALTMRDARVHNIRAAFVAGLAAGSERITLLMQQGEDPVPLDYRVLPRASSILIALTNLLVSSPLM
jgi:hypothetical protein